MSELRLSITRQVISGLSDKSTSTRFQWAKRIYCEAKKQALPETQPIGNDDFNCALCDSVRNYQVQELPAHIYLNLPLSYVSILLTLPNESLASEIPETFTNQKDDSGQQIVLVFNNCGHVTVTKDYHGEELRHDSTKKPILLGVFCHGQIIPLKEYLMATFGSAKEFMGTSDLYLYRAITSDELEKIVGNRGHYFIRIRTNFEDRIGGQVTDHAQREGYSNVIIRIKANSKSFLKTNPLAPRVESRVPLWAECEFLLSQEGEPERWGSLEEFQRQRGVTP